jgi:hypothetical protein
VPKVVRAVDAALYQQEHKAHHIPRQTRVVLHNRTLCSLRWGKKGEKNEVLATLEMESKTFF